MKNNRKKIKNMPITHCYNPKFEQELGDLDKFLKEMILVLGGSFVNAQICETVYPGSDLDFYAGYPLKKRDDGSVDSEFDDFIVNSMGGVLIKNINYQDKSYKYICPEITINIIYTGKTSKDEIIEYVNQTSDLDICTSTYDGFLTRFSVAVLTKKASIINEHLIETTFECSAQGSERCVSYAKFHSIFTIKRKTRQYKYSTRGFTILGSTLDSFDEYNAKTFLENQASKEEYIRTMLRFIAAEVQKNTSLHGSASLHDVLRGRHIFTFRNDAPIISIHHSLDYEMYPWARFWNL
jgi:hypothetical protein